MILTTVTDEVQEQMALENIFETAKQQGIYNFEIRAIEGRRVPDFDDDMIRRLKNCKKEQGVTFSAISPGIFKVPLGSEEFNYHKDKLLTASLDFAEELGINRIIIFGIQRSEKDRLEDYQQVVNEIGEAAYKAKKRGMEILIENEPGWWADTSENCSNILKSISCRNLKLNWDLGNLYNSGEKDYKKGYELLKDYIANVHVKDMLSTDGGVICVPAGEGEIDYESQLKDLEQDGYNGCITIETHMSPLYPNFLKSSAYIKKILNW
ncbi:sugar phosphate isomerase/epimerase [Anaerocolumna sp. AGMB13025]|uniref:sugar phosphate isomerase/epimerase family protein n=1 Tax=Anaerocolumna sp. AGMB13025 TaxID=3039116 RepID=UPI00241DFB61|nr:sugar phosphate isomerase/epimerase family protein [Anaerocolumna sp. AGMB13025]WFR56005.1 sugar phosphate isomerase/epimerase [Anaerocolumna sp. AGMB13025]